jgi:hypothetical protein
MIIGRLTLSALALALLAGCGGGPSRGGYPYVRDNGMVPAPVAPPVIRQPVVPEMLVQCRGHVLVPALGMYFVARGQDTPPSGQYLREENLTPPYRILPPRAIITKEFSAARVNVELDDQRRIIGLYCG